MGRGTEEAACGRSQSQADRSGAVAARPQGFWVGRLARYRVWDERLPRLVWTLADQGIVSAGSFIVQLVLARTLAPAEYGLLVLIYGGLLTLQLCNATLLFHPMSVRLSAASPDVRKTLLGASLVMLAVTTIGFGGVLAAILVGFRHSELAVPAFVCFCAWQTQEGLRRGLLSSFRHAAAMTGDSLFCLGQAGLVVSLGALGLLSIGSALYAIALCAGVGAVAHALRLSIRLPSAMRLREILVDYWAIGGAFSLGNGLLAAGRTIILPWALAALGGSAAAAGYQAANNVVNLSNPLILGLANIIPQAAASACGEGYRHAWRTVRGYLFLAAPPILTYSVAVFVLPEDALRLLYGEASQYVHLALPLRLLIMVSVTGFATEAVVAFLHGLALVRRAALINAAGTATSLALAFPLIDRFGLIGGCAALLLANFVRLALANIAVTRLTASANQTA